MTTPSSPLSEQDFIHDEYKQNPYPFWFWLIVISIFVFALSSGYNWYSTTLVNEYKKDPFLQVTNREMSLFLWQNPSYMRISASGKSAYMPGFQYVEKISLDLPFADDYVIAPPEVFFRYHVWKRLISSEFIERPIPLNEFKDFLNYALEWLPQNWPAKPENYEALIANLSEQKDLAKVLPQTVKQAFQGWKNYFIEGPAINALTPTYKDVRSFLSLSPHYARNYWYNIIGDDYLRSLTEKEAESSAFIPSSELPSFLRVAIFNYIDSK